MKKIFKRSVWTLLAIFFALIFVIVLVGDTIASDFESWIDSFFDVTRYQLVNDESGEDPEETQYFKSDYALKDENGKLALVKDDQGVYHQTYDNAAMRAHSLDVAERVGEEGSVLLWNFDNALPLSKGDKVTTFGMSSILGWQLSGRGSGSVDISNPPDYLATLREKGLDVNKAFENVLKLVRARGASRSYGEYGYEIWEEKGQHLHFSVNEASWTLLMQNSKNQNVADSVGEYGDAALFVVTRQGGEEGDTLYSGSESEDNSYLSFTNEERTVIEGLIGLKKANVIKKIVLLINAAAPMNLKYVKDDISAEGVDACLWVGIGGNVQYNYVADLLLGNANPSGRLTDTWVYDCMSAPANANFGKYTFTESEGVPADWDNTYTTSGNYNKEYVVYQEGIYVGYRYYETRYEDYVLGGRGADSVKGSMSGASWKYGDEVAYTFGHGESYTTFSYGKLSVRKDGTDYKLSVSVTNTGSVAGKEVVEIYLQKPYTQYDIENKVEKSAVDLVGFAKTGLLEPGKSETVEITVPEYEFKSYDSNGKKTYILEAGDYYLAAGRDAHDALNNILAAKSLTSEQKSRMDGEGDTDLVYKASYSHDVDTYAVSPFTNAAVTNQFDDVDVNRYVGTKNQGVKYLSRRDWNDTYPTTNAVLTCTDPQMVADLQYGKAVVEDPEAEMPLYDTVTSEYGKLTLIQLKGVPFDDPLWDDLLNQMSFAEQVDIMRRGAHRIAGATSVAAPGFLATDGPCGIHAGIAEGLDNQMAEPCNPIVASTFNVELIEEYGEAFGMEILHIGYVGIYGLGTNIHRSAYGGRAWEYYSEDGFLAGKIFTAANNGLLKKGIVMFTKHFVLNEQEICRAGVTTWSNEQALREIYLKPFETGVTEGHTNGLMTSFNRIGCTWVGLHKGLLTNVLRGEWGFEGLTETDSPTAPHMRTSTTTIYASGLIAGQDVWMGSVNETDLDEYRSNATVMQALRQAVHRVLYVQANSAAMNGLTSSTRVVYVTPAWEQALLAVEILSGIFTAASLAMLAVSWVFWYKDERKTKN